MAQASSSGVDTIAQYKPRDDEYNSNGSHQQVQRRKYNYGGNPLANIQSYDGSLYGPFGGALQPGLYKPPKNNPANPAPLGLAGFAFTTFLLSLINLGTRGLSQPNIVVGPAYAYGGLCQLLAGMWEIAQGNTFGGTALSSYGGFWISLGVILTPGGFDVQSAYANTGDFYAAFGLYLFGWMIFTILMWLLTLRATLVFNLLLLTVWLTFMLLGISYTKAQGNADGLPDVTYERAGGGMGIAASFLAWYLMLAGMADSSNSFFVMPVLHCKCLNYFHVGLMMLTYLRCSSLE